MALNRVSSTLDIDLAKVSAVQLISKQGGGRPWRHPRFVIDVLIEGHLFRVGDFQFGTEEEPDKGVASARKLGHERQVEIVRLVNEAKTRG